MDDINFDEITMEDCVCRNPMLDKPQWYFTHDEQVWSYGPVDSINNLTRPTTDVNDFAADLAFITGVGDWKSLIPKLLAVKAAWEAKHN